jgi:hypothetical protein
MDKENKKLFGYVLIGVVIFLIIYLVINSCSNKEGMRIDASSRMLLNRIGRNSEDEMTSNMSMNAFSPPVPIGDIAEDETLDYYKSFNTDQMRIGKSLSFQDATTNKYAKIRDMYGIE